MQVVISNERTACIVWYRKWNFMCYWGELHAWKGLKKCRNSWQM